MSSPNPIRRFPLQTDQWTPIVTPVDCSHFAILGNADGSPMLRSSDPQDQNAWHQLTGSYAFIVAPPGGCRTRWRAGDTLGYLKSVAGTGPAIVEFISPQGYW